MCMCVCVPVCLCVCEYPPSLCRYSYYFAVLMFLVVASEGGPCCVHTPHIRCCKGSAPHDHHPTSIDVHTHTEAHPTPQHPAKCVCMGVPVWSPPLPSPCLTSQTVQPANEGRGTHCLHSSVALYSSHLSVAS